MRVVITGASGFLGKYVAEKLSFSGVEWIGLSRDDVPGLVKVVDYAEAPDGDILIHLAEANNRSWVNQQGFAYEDKALAVMRRLLNRGYKRVVYASSAVLYGDKEIIPRKESDSIVVSDSYTRNKYNCEQLTLNAGGTAVRFSNLYGPGMSSENVLSAILKQLIDDNPITLFDTSPVRDFLWVDDAAECLVSIIREEINGVINVGSGIPTAIGELAQLILRCAGQEHRAVISKIQSSNESTLVLDRSVAREKLGWEPKMSLNDGLKKLIQLHLKENAYV